jgi:hypothetical protein
LPAVAGVAAKLRLAAALLANGLSVAAATAHQLSVRTGTVVIDQDRIAVTIEVPAEDFRHDDTAPPEASCSRGWLEEARTRHEPVLLASLVIRDADGDRLKGRVLSSTVPAPIEDSFEWDRLRRIQATYRLEYTLPGTPRFLTFQLRFGEAPAPLNSQLALDVRRKGERSGRTIRLTSRGNAETLEFPTGKTAASGPTQDRNALPAPERFNTIFSIIRADEGALEIETHVPLTLLETWQPVARRDADIIDPAEQAEACRVLAGLLAGAHRVLLDGAPRHGESAEMGILPPGAAGLAIQSEPHRASVWTARVAVRMRYGCAAPCEAVELRWGLFNNAVLTGRAVVTARGRTFEHEFTTYDPVLAIERVDGRR